MGKIQIIFCSVFIIIIFVSKVSIGATDDKKEESIEDTNETQQKPYNIGSEDKSDINTEIITPGTVFRAKYPKILRPKPSGHTSHTPIKGDILLKPSIGSIKPLRHSKDPLKYRQLINDYINSDFLVDVNHTSVQNQLQNELNDTKKFWPYIRPKSLKPFQPNRQQITDITEEQDFMAYIENVENNNDSDNNSIGKRNYPKLGTIQDFNKSEILSKISNDLSNHSYTELSDLFDSIFNTKFSINDII